MADISYTPTTWADGQEGGTPIDSTKLNNIEQGIVDAVAAIGPNDTTQDGTLKAQIDALGESVSKAYYGVTAQGVNYVRFDFAPGIQMQLLMDIGAKAFKVNFYTTDKGWWGQRTVTLNNPWT